MSGDNLWDIAAKNLGDPTKWTAIYDASRSVIETAARAFGHATSDHGNLIFPGTSLHMACPAPGLAETAPAHPISEVLQDLPDLPAMPGGGIRFPHLPESEPRPDAPSEFPHLPELPEVKGAVVCQPDEVSGPCLGLSTEQVNYLAEAGETLICVTEQVAHNPVVQRFVAAGIWGAYVAARFSLLICNLESELQAPLLRTLPGGTPMNVDPAELEQA